MLSIVPKSSSVHELYLSHPGLQHTGDAGIDLLVPHDLIIPARALGFPIDHQVACAMMKSGSYISYYLYPRSSISKTPLRMCNSVGIIDSGYRGNIIGMVDNVSDTDYCVKKGTRLFQICMPTLEPLMLELVTSLPPSERGSGGFGSTGV